MKFPRNIEVSDYDDDAVTIGTPGAFVSTLTVKDGDDVVQLLLYASESKALRKALKAAEADLVTPYHFRRDSSV